MDKLDGKTFDVVKDNIEKMKELFPDIFTEGKIDMDKFMLTLGEHVEKDKERYEFTWNGKTKAIQLAQKQTTGTLKPHKKNSMNWESTNNLFIEGDNIEVLRILQNSYRNKVKMIYIDPPYNTGKDFIYKDNFKDNISNYKDHSNENMKSNPHTQGRFHTNWLNMMYPRLKIARNLMKNDGVIFISIDDNEVHNLRRICDDIFGEHNFIAQLPTVMNLKGNNDQYGFSGTHEYTIVYTKNKEETNFGLLPVPDDQLTDWREDEHGFYKKGANLKATGVNAPRKKRPNLFFPIYINENMELKIERENPNDIEIFPITNGQEMSWRWSKEKFVNEPHNIIVVKGDSGEYSIYKKTRPLEADEPTQKPKSLFYKPEYSSGNGTNQIRQLFGEKVFSNPKPVELLKDFIRIGLGKNIDGIVLDFFAGSSTTAQAVMELNLEDNGNRKFIMIQLPELLDENNPDQKAAVEYLKAINKPLNISEISQERIRNYRRLISDNSENNRQSDLGFKVFQLESTNIKKWDEESLSLEKDLLELVNPIKEDRTQEDVVYEVLLKYGVDLTAPIEQKNIAGKSIYDVGMGYLLICLERDLTLDIVEQIAELKPKRVVFYDESFKDDTVRTNAQQILKRHNVEDIRVI